MADNFVGLQRNGRRVAMNRSDAAYFTALSLAPMPMALARNHRTKSARAGRDAAFFQRRLLRDFGANALGDGFSI